MVFKVHIDEGIMPISTKPQNKKLLGESGRTKKAEWQFVRELEAETIWKVTEQEAVG